MEVGIHKGSRNRHGGHQVRIVVESSRHNTMYADLRERKVERSIHDEVAALMRCAAGSTR